jgi:hypothetical protein
MQIHPFIYPHFVYLLALTKSHLHNKNTLGYLFTVLQDVTVLAP